MTTHHPDCDVNDVNPDGIVKPCNCGASQPYTVERTTRRVIEGKLLDSLADGQHVAILASKQDLEDMIEALRRMSVRSDPLGLRCSELSTGLERLKTEAFGK